MYNYAALLEEYRGDLLENVHFGHIAIVDKDSKLIYSAGDPGDMVFYRSASKPVQALPTIAMGLDRKYGLTGRESAIFSGSHTGQDVHMEALDGIMTKTGIKEEDMIMLPSYPQDRQSELERIESGLPLRKAYHNCSGKHLSLMLLQRELTGSTADYWRIESAAQQSVLRSIACVSEVEPDSVGIGVDGCGVPVFALPLKNIAAAFKNLALPDRIGDDALAGAAERYIPEINRNPIMMRGRGLLCGCINEDQNMIAKGGAMGVYGIGLKKEGIGISLKIADGTDYLWPFLVAAILEKIGYSDKESIGRILAVNSGRIRNDNGVYVGHCKAVFELER